MKPATLRPAKGGNTGKRLIRKKTSVLPMTEQQFINNVNCEWVVAIDPDKDLCGYAVVSRNTGKIVDLMTLDVFDIMQQIKIFDKKNVVIYVELPLSTYAWHGETSNMQQSNIKARINNAATKGMDIGINRGVAITLIKVLSRAGYNVQQVEPLPKINGEKCNHADFVKRTGWDGGQTNQEKRDSGLIAYHFR